MAIRIVDVDQNTEAWHALRDPLVTGSNSDVLLTQGAQEAASRNLKRFRGNYYTARGHRLEPIAIKVYEGIHDTVVDRVGFVLNDDYPNGGCSPDGIDGQWLIEVKCFSERNHKAITKLEDITFKIMSQLQFNMMMCELPKARLVMYNPDLPDVLDQYCEIEVLADKPIQANMQQKLLAQ